MKTTDAICTKHTIFGENIIFLYDKMRQTFSKDIKKNPGKSGVGINF